ncbi:acyltransferase [Amylibacter sp.]|nr:acyltransferase [Amylibacter sp.]
MKYRPEIDGLRALAVLPVILFHAGFEYFSGGFVGVDVFFVISGYLITTIIISEMAEGKFSIVNFYERRARRILPALFFVMAACLPFALFWLTPIHLKDFGQSILAVSTFSSNILFWWESGYFGTAAELKPLLHTWSLAVEEQYYILFPVFLMSIWRLGIKWVLIILSITFFVSLGTAQWGAYKSPSAAFFLLPTRGWELLVGALAAFYLKYNAHVKSHSINQVLSLLGFLMIIFSISTFDETTPFPSLYALTPTIGTGLLIICAVPKTLVHKLLSLKFVVGIGLISYSAYLWHQPLLAFARHKLLGEVSYFNLVVLCIFSLLMAWFSWRFVELPFRNRQRFNRTSIFRLSAIGIFIFSTIGLTLHFTNGLERLKILSYTIQERRVYDIIKINTDYDLYDIMHSSKCKLWAKDISDISTAEFDECSKRFGKPLVVLGDSHAMNLYNIFAHSKAYDFVVGLSQGFCRPHTPKIGCHYNSSADFLKEIAPLEPIIVYHQAGSYFFTDENGSYQPPTNKEVFFDANNVKKVNSYLNYLADFGLNVIWLGAFTEYGISPKLYAPSLKKIPRYSFRVFDQIDISVRETIEKKEQEKSYKYISFNDLYKITEQVIFDDCLIWRDADHFSTCGEKHIAQNADWAVLLPLITNE